MTGTGGYRLVVTSDELDAARFQELVAAARKLIDGDPRQAAALLEDAQGLWRGPAFGELAAHEQLRGEAMRLERLRSEAAADLLDADLALGRAIAAARTGRWTAHRPGARWEELGVDPSPSLQELHEQMLRQAPALTAPPPSPAAGREPVGARPEPGTGG